jgi:hypothetical protein
MVLCGSFISGQKGAREFWEKHNHYLFLENLFRYTNPYRRKHIVKIQYKNDSSAIVNIRGKKLRPGASIVSQVFVKSFEEFVKKGDLVVYIDDVKINFEQVPAIEAQIANGESVEISADNKIPETVAGKITEFARQEKLKETPEVAPSETLAEEKSEESGKAEIDVGDESITETIEAESDTEDSVETETGEKPVEEITAKIKIGDKIVEETEARKE